MTRAAVELGVCLTLACGVHLAVFPSLGDMGVQSSGAGGSAQVSLMASSASIEAMVAEWETPPEAQTMPAAFAMPPAPETSHPVLPPVGETGPSAAPPDALHAPLPDAPAETDRLSERAPEIVMLAAPQPGAPQESGMPNIPSAPEAPAPMPAPDVLPMPGRDAPAEMDRPSDLAPSVAAMAVPELAAPEAPFAPATPQGFAAPVPPMPAPAPAPAPPVIETAPSVETAPPPVPVESSPQAVAVSQRPPMRPERPVTAPEPAPQPAAPSPQPSQSSPAQTASGTGGGTAAGANAAGETSIGQGEARQLLARWGGQIRAAIERRKRFPRGVTASGTARVALTVSTDGTLVSARLVGSAGHPALDQAALAAVQTARLPRAVRGVPDGVHSFEIGLTFSR